MTILGFQVHAWGDTPVAELDPDSLQAAIDSWEPYVVLFYNGETPPTGKAALAQFTADNDTKQFAVGQIDTDKYQQVLRLFNVMRVPSIIIYRQRQVQGIVTTVESADQLKRDLGNYI